MPVYYVDTSALVKRYHVEPGSDRIDQLFADPTASFLTASLTLTELTSALDRKVQDGTITHAVLQAALAVVARDLLEEFWLDALHLAALLSVREAAPILVSADHRLLDAARQEQLAVLNPVTDAR